MTDNKTGSSAMVEISRQSCSVFHSSVIRKITKLLTEFTSLSHDDVAIPATATAQLLDKSSIADPVPISVLKSVSDLLPPFLTHLFHQSLSIGFVLFLLHLNF